MRGYILVILALVGAAAATEEAAKTVTEPTLHVEQRSAADDIRMLSVYSAPSDAQDSYISSETFDVKEIFDSPIFFSFKNAEKNVIESYLLKEGLKSVYTLPEFAFIQKFLLSGPAKAAFTMSAAHFMEFPELKYYVPEIKTPHDFTYGDIFSIYSKKSSKIPFLLVVARETIPFEKMAKLVELGQFSLSADHLKVVRDNHHVQPAVFSREYIRTEGYDSGESFKTHPETLYDDSGEFIKGGRTSFYVKDAGKDGILIQPRPPHFRKIDVEQEYHPYLERVAGTMHPHTVVSEGEYMPEPLEVSSSRWDSLLPARRLKTDYFTSSRYEPEYSFY